MRLANRRCPRRGTCRGGNLAGQPDRSCHAALFPFSAGILVGLLSLSERLSLDTFAQTAQTRIIPASEAAAKEFADLTQHAARGRSFFYRCRVLHLVAMIFGDAMPVGPEPATNVATTLLRFEEIISRIPDADLIHYHRRTGRNVRMQPPPFSADVS